MASASIRCRQTKSGPRFQVRCRLGGRAYPVQHGGSFPTLKEARTRRDFIAGELAAGETLPRRCGRSGSVRRCGRSASGPRRAASTSAPRHARTCALTCYA